MEEIEKIKQKILAGNFDFTYEENEYTLLVEELKNLIIDYASKNETNQTIYDYFNENADYFDVSENLDIFYNIAMFSIKTADGEIEDDEEFEEVISLFTNEEQIKNLTNAYREFSKNRSKTEKIDHHLYEYDYKNVEMLLNNKNYEKINQMHGYINYDDDNIKQQFLERFRREYPIEKYGFPSIFVKDELLYFIDMLKYMSIEDIINLFNYYTDTDSFQKSEQLEEKIINALNEKISNVDNLKKYNFDNYQTFYHNKFNIFDTTKLVNKLVISNPCNCFLIPFYSTFSEENIKQIVDLIRTNEDWYNIFRKVIFKSQNFTIMNEKEILKVIIEKNDLNLISNFNTSDLTDEVSKIIINLMENGNKDIINSLNENIVLYENNTYFSSVFKRALELNLITRLGVRYVHPDTEINNLKNKYIETHPNLELINYLSPKMFLSSEELIALLKIERYDLCSKWFNVKFNEHLPMVFDVLLEKISKSTELSVRLLKSDASDYIIKNDQILNMLLEKNDITIYYLLKVINNEASFEYLYNKDIYEKTKVFISKFYHYDIEKMDYIVSRCGYKILKYLESNNIKEMLQLPIEKIKKIIEIFPKVDFSIKDIEGIYDSIKQYSYSKEHPEVIAIFSNILHSIQDNDNRYMEYLKEISLYMDEKFIKLLEDKYPEFKITNPLEFCIMITNNIKKNDENSVRYINILHDITNGYLDKKRGELNKNYNEIYIPYTFVEKSLVTFLVEYFSKKGYISYFDRVISIVDELSRQLGMSFELTNSIIKYLNNPKEYNDDNIDEVRQNIKNYKKVVEQIIRDNFSKIVGGNISLIEDAVKKNMIKVEYNVVPEDIDIYSWLTELRLDIINEKLLDSKAYDALINCMQKRKIHILPDYIINFINKYGIDIKYDQKNVIAFINYFYKIYETELRNFKLNGGREEDFDLSIISILKKSEIFGGLSSIYSLVLGKVDAKLIAANEGPNSANNKVGNNQRLNEALEWTIQNFKRKEVTIPTFNEVLEVNGKKMRCIVGNFTHPSNLTHGERTGACMRIGGVGESLFDFTLSDKNGFHIRFEDPYYGTYISRVSGFRNGNTIFLNELRCSCEPDKYNDEEITEFCKKTSELLVEMSKNSSCPIDNVVIHRAYATTSYPGPEEYITSENIQTGLRKFYCDVNNRAIVLATSNEDNSLVSVNFDKSNVPTYMPTREKIIATADVHDILSIMNRVHAIKMYLANQTFTGIIGVEDFLIESGFKYGIANQDWYIYVDENNNIHEEYIDFDERVKIEMEVAKKQIIEIANIKENGGNNELQNRKSSIV